LFDPAGPAYAVSIEVAVAIAATIGLFMVFAVAKIVAARRRPVEVGVQSLVGSTGIARRTGQVLVNGELWHARTPDGEPLEPGERIVVDAVDGLELEVRPLREAARMPHAVS
jgi:membrane-bound serine protease (ClpP class)